MPSNRSLLRYKVWLLIGLAVVFVTVWRAPTFFSVPGLASYLPLHMFAETFAIVISMMVFGVAWNSYKAERPGNIMILACGLLAIGLIDFAHMLSFKGMPDFITPSGPEKAINFWLSARLILALVLLAVAIRPWQQPLNSLVRYGLLAASLIIAAVVIWLGVAYPDAWPHTFIEGKGLTAFKVGAEYVIIALLLIPAVRFYVQAKRTQSHEAASLFAASVITILSELSFTIYSDVADIFNLLGHLYSIVAYIFIYRAVFVGSVREPFRRLDAELAENKRITQQIQDSASERNQLAAIVEFSNDGIISKTPDGIITSWNNGAERIYGYAAEEVIGKPITILALPEQHAELQLLLEKIHNGEVIQNHETERVRKDGSHLFVSLSLSPIRDDSGKITSISTIARDITESKRIEQDIIAREFDFRTLVENSSDPILRYNRDCQRVYVNPEIHRISGKPLDSLLGHKPEDAQLLGDTEAKKLTTAIRQTFDSDQTRHVEFDFIDLNGTQHSYDMLLIPEHDADGQVKTVLGIARDITERQLAAEALRREQALLSRIMVTSPVGIAVVNREGQITFANPQAEKILGLSKEKIAQLCYNAPEWHSTAIDGSSFPDEAQPFSRVMATRQPVFDVQHAIAWPDGRRVLLSINGAPIFNAQEEIEAVAFSIEDITGRKQAEEKLRRSEHGLSEAQRIAHLGNWELNLAKNELTWSAEIFRIFEIDPEKFGASYEAFLNAIHPDDRDMVNKAYTDSVKNKVPYDIVHRLQMPDGRIKYVNEKCETYYRADGTPIRSMGTVHDITERKLDELALLEQQSHSDSLLHLSRRLERAQSYEDILTAAGDEVRKLIGYRNLWVYLLSDDRQYFTALIGTGEGADRSIAQEGVPRLIIAGDQMLEQIAAAKEIVIIEDAQTSDIVNREIVQKLGNRTIVNIPIILFDRHLGTVGVGTFGDEGIRVPTASEQKYLLAMASHMAAALDHIYLLNERRSAEQEVRELNRDLEQRVAERTEQLEAANKELESFSYSVSHDLRTPLRAIDGFSNILLEDYKDKLDDEGKRLLKVVRENTSKMGQLIDDILNFSRTGRVGLTASEIDMERMAHTVFDELQTTVVGNKPQLEMASIPPARGDSAMLRQVLVNLLSNAIKFSRDQKKPLIRVSASVKDGETIYTVKDNGVGFDMQYADKLFGVFQRLHSVNEFEGTGIGLAIVKRIITRHGGRVWAESKTNEGATFYFALPNRERSHE